jgi:hypothetical protein
MLLVPGVTPGIPLDFHSAATVNEFADGGLFENDGATRAQYGFSRAEHVPGYANSR